MVESKPIAQEEFEAIAGKEGTGYSEESLLIKALEPLQGIKFPCRWKHHTSKAGQTHCYGLSNFRSLGNKHNLNIRTRCKDGAVYIFRYD